jgi:hypothetical protein
MLTINFRFYIYVTTRSKDRIPIRNAHVAGDNKFNAQCFCDVFCVVAIDNHCLTQQNDFTKVLIFVDDITK